MPVLGVAGALSFDAGQKSLIQLVDKMLDSFFPLSKLKADYKMAWC